MSAARHRKVSVVNGLLAIVAIQSVIWARPSNLPQAASAARAQNGDSTPSYLGQIKTREDFDSLARIYYRGRFYALPHLMFVVDRQDHDRVYYVNSKKFMFHKDFVNGTYLSLERGRAFYQNNYLKKDRRFILGSIAYQTQLDKYSFEFWEGDTIDSSLLSEANQVLSATFFAPLYFKPNSPSQDRAASQAIAAYLPYATTSGVLSPLRVLTQSELSGSLAYEPLNLAKGIGQLRILDRLTPDTVIDRNQIVIFKEVPVHLTPLSGIITTTPASPLSHINMLAKSWGIPNAYIKEADKLFKPLEGKYVSLVVGEDTFHLEPANVSEVEDRQRRFVQRADLVTPAADLNFRVLTDLKDQRSVDINRFGGKSANLGEIIHARVPGITVPPGFTIPFGCYRDFLRENSLEERIRGAVEEDRFVHDPKFRRGRLAEIREWIVDGKLNQRFAARVVARALREFPRLGVFVRSSTNAEDLPNFSGAGLYTTVPNVRTREQLLAAIKTVWASVWNYEAYEARESFGMNHFGVYPAVLVQLGIDADSAGVAITTDPFNTPADEPGGPGAPFQPIATPRAAPTSAGPAAVYINAKRGLGMKVVEGKTVAEQVIYRPATGAIQVLTRSGEDTMLKFDPHGGIKEEPIEKDRRVLTDPMIKVLSDTALELKSVFKGRDQDIEWVFAKGNLFIVQSRPYVAAAP